jgi:hypothetical protein
MRYHQGPLRGAYQHDMFLRDDKALSLRITRRKIGPSLNKKPLAPPPGLPIMAGVVPQKLAEPAPQGALDMLAIKKQKKQDNIISSSDPQDVPPIDISVQKAPNYTVSTSQDESMSLLVEPQHCQQISVPDNMFRRLFRRNGSSDLMMDSVESFSEIGDFDMPSDEEMDPVDLSKSKIATESRTEVDVLEQYLRNLESSASLTLPIDLQTNVQPPQKPQSQSQSQSQLDTDDTDTTTMNAGLSTVKETDIPFACELMDVFSSSSGDKNEAQTLAAPTVSAVLSQPPKFPTRGALLPSSAASQTNISASSPAGRVSSSIASQGPTCPHPQDPLNAEHSFPWKLYDLVEGSTQGYEHIVSWQLNGCGFKVHDHDAFFDKVMPLYFDQGKYESFRRQLNLYQFTRISRGHNRGIYMHKFFVRGRRDLCKFISRRSAKPNGQAAAAAKK